MRILEIFLLVGLLLSALNILFIRNAKGCTILPAFSVVFASIGIGAEGYRFVMTPAYILAAALFVFSLVKRFIKARKKHLVLKGFTIVAFFLFYMLSIALPIALPIIDLPEPGGAQLVGTMRLDFTNPARRELLTGSTAAQATAVQVWYPASDTGNGKPALWMDSRKAASLLAQMQGIPDILGQLCLIRTNSYWNAPLSNKTARYPVILFSGGAGMFNGQNTIQMEELASQGYIVFAVSHPYDDFASVYTNGDIIPYRINQFEALIKDSAGAIAEAKQQVTDENSPDFHRALIRNCKLNTENVRIWSDDLIFVADQIIRLNDGSIPSIFKNRLEPENIAIFGHSFGGAAAGQACLADSRFKAFINLDGTPFGDTVDNVIEQPFMIICAAPGPDAKITPDSGYSQEQKDYLIVMVEGSKHVDYTDLRVIIPYAGKAIGLFGTISSERQTEIMNAYIVSFFNRHLKGIPAPMLETVPPHYPEIKIKNIKGI